MAKARFDWDPAKDQENRTKHGVSFSLAQLAFRDRRRVIAEDATHSSTEKRFFCFGRIGQGILTVRFTYRGRVIRIFGAGFWRKGKRIYERENQVHRRTPRRAARRP
jgi:hypothetical protein